MRAFPGWKGRVRYWSGYGCKIPDLLTYSLLSRLDFNPRELRHAIKRDRRFRVYTLDAASVQEAGDADPRPEEGEYVALSRPRAAAARARTHPTRSGAHRRDQGAAPEPRASAVAPQGTRHAPTPGALRPLPS